MNGRREGSRTAVRSFHPSPLRCKTGPGKPGSPGRIAKLTNQASGIDIARPPSLLFAAVSMALIAVRRQPSLQERLPMRGPRHLPAVLVSLCFGFGAVAGCSRPLGIVQKASDGAEALTNRAEETFKDVGGKVDAFGDRLKAKVKDLGDDLTTWKTDDGATITPTSAVRVDQGPIVR